MYNIFIFIIYYILQWPRSAIRDMYYISYTYNIYNMLSLQWHSPRRKSSQPISQRYLIFLFTVYCIYIYIYLYVSISPSSPVTAIAWIFTAIAVTLLFLLADVCGRECGSRALWKWTPEGQGFQKRWYNPYFWAVLDALHRRGQSAQRAPQLRAQVERGLL